MELRDNMTDIVERLDTALRDALVWNDLVEGDRACNDADFAYYKRERETITTTITEAADTITNLRAEVAALREGLDMWKQRYRAVPNWRLRPTHDDQDFVVALNTTRALLETNHA